VTLKDSIHQLCSEHLRTGPDNRPHKVPALLDELRSAVKPGNSMSGGGASGAPSPINVSALDLLAEIEAGARSDYLEMCGVAWTGTLERLLPWIAGLDITAEWDSYLSHALSDYIDKINALLWPVKPRRKLTGKRCPACGYSMYGEERKTCLSLGCWDDEGGMKKIGDWDIECASCEAAWSGDQVSWLLRALDTPEEVLTQAG
jgi:hypothetical protein